MCCIFLSTLTGEIDAEGPPFVFTGRSAVVVGTRTDAFGPNF